MSLFNDYGEVFNSHALPQGMKWILNTEDITYIQRILDAQPTLYLDGVQTMLSNDQGVDVSLATVSHALWHLALTNKNVLKEDLEQDDILRAT